MITLVKEKKEKIYSPIIKELKLNIQLMMNNILINPYIFYNETVNRVLLNEDYYLISNIIKSWLSEYLNMFYLYSKLFESKYKVFLTFLDYINKEYSINIDKTYYSTDFYCKCLISILKQDKEIIGNVIFTYTINQKKEIDINTIIYNLCNENTFKNDLIRSNELLVLEIKELICVFDIMINIINIKYLKMIDYI